MLTIEAHPLLCHQAFLTTFPAPLAQCPSPDWLHPFFALDADGAPVQRQEEVRQAVRKLLRHGGYRPTGRGKPASEYLVRAAETDELSPINLAVDACNASSLQSGLPISVIDLDRAEQPLSIRIAGKRNTYVFNASGQEIRLDGLLCLFDATGPCANAVKDAQRTKTTESTTRTLSIVWGTNVFPEQTSETTRWYRSLLEKAGAATEDLAAD